MRSIALPDSRPWTTQASAATAPRSSTKRAASTRVPISSSTMSATFPATSPIRFTARDLVVPGASLVHNRDWQVQAGRVVADVFRLTHVAGDEHVVREVTALAQVVTEDQRCLELVGWDAKKALHLGRVQVHCEDAISPVASAPEGFCGDSVRVRGAGVMSRCRLPPEGAHVGFALTTIVEEVP
jgi:hypothetical protein